MAGTIGASHFKCGVCLDFVERPHETRCCAQLFCEECIAHGGMVGHSCPVCRRWPLKHSPSFLAQRLLSNVTVPCPHDCGETPSGDKYWEHCREKCAKRIVPRSQQSANDNKVTTRKRFSAHSFHERLVMELYIRPRRRALDPQQAPPPVVQENPETDLIVPKTNRAGRISRLGSTGKFYCGAQIENSACATSNHSGCKGGICGPTNGCNCLPCMELDIKIRRLPPGFLVNRGGAPCRLQAQSATQFLLSFVGCNPTWYCGRTMPEIRAKCTPSKPCDDCSHMKQVGHIHYAELLSSLNNPSFSAGNSSYAADPTTPRMNRFGRTTRMSWNGKLYCGGPLDLASESEDNVCGPHAGSPCSACMMIDVAVRKLPDGYLINNCGAPARPGLSGPFYCGRRAPELQNQIDSDGWCGPNVGPQCQACEVLDRLWSSYSNDY